MDGERRIPLFKTIVCVASVIMLAVLPLTARADLTHFYCYAPDRTTGTVFVSSVLPVGPVNERARYGSEFVAHLKRMRRITADIPGYCVMRESAEALSRSRDMLSQQASPELRGLKQFTEVDWARGSARMSTPPPANRVRVVESEASGPWVVVLGNAETGKLLVMSRQPNLEQAAFAEAKRLRSSGWVKLLSTRQPGFGAVVCIQTREETRFVVAEGKPTVREAVLAARAAAEPFASRLQGKVRVCAAPWEARAGGADRIELDAQDEAIDWMENKVREQVVCQPTREKRCPPVKNDSPRFGGPRG